MTEGIYTFEESTHKNFRSRADTAEDLKTLSERIKLDFSGPAGEFVELLQDLIINCHMVIEWYQKKRTKVVWQKRAYFFVSLTLLALIPLIVFMISDKYATSGTNLTAQITIVLTGLIGVQRAMSAWLDDRKVLGSYTKAVSDLKKEYYGFEQRWENREIDSTSRDEFEKDLMNVIDRSRMICDEEQTSYFQNLSYPSLDLAQIMKTASADAADLTKRFTHPSLARMKTLETARQESNQADALVTHFQALLDDLEMERDRLSKFGTSDEQLAAMTRDIESVVAKLRSAQIDAAIAKAARTALED